MSSTENARWWIPSPCSLDVVLIHDRRFHRDAPLIGNGSVPLPSLDQLVVNDLTVIPGITQYGMVDLEFRQAELLPVTETGPGSRMANAYWFSFRPSRFFSPQFFIDLHPDLSHSESEVRTFLPAPVSIRMNSRSPLPVT